MKKWRWDNRKILYIYYNDEKLKAILSRIYDSVETEFQRSTKLGRKANMKLAARFGSVLAWLGIGEASGEIGSEIMKESARVSRFEVSTYNMLRGLVSYCIKNEEFPCFDIYNGDRVEFSKNEEGYGRHSIDSEDRIGGIGKIAGLFKLRRIEPEQDKNTSVTKDLFKRKINLWLCESICESSIRSEIPFLTNNFRHTSQAALVDLARPVNSVIPIESIGMLTWKDGILYCDPLAWGVIK